MEEPLFWNKKKAPVKPVIIDSHKERPNPYVCPYSKYGCPGTLKVAEKGESVNLRPYQYEANHYSHDYGEILRERRTAPAPELRSSTQIVCSGCMEVCLGSLKGSSELTLENGGLTESLIRAWVKKHPTLANNTKEGRKWLKRNSK